MSTTTYAEPEIAALSGDDPWGRCGNEVHSLNILIQWLMKHPRPCPIAELGRVADGMQQVVMGVQYSTEELINTGVKEIKSATETIQATCGEWTCGTEPLATRMLEMLEKRLQLLQQLAEWFREHPKNPWVPSTPGRTWATQLTEVMVGMQETILLGGIKDHKVRQTIGRTVFDKTNVVVKNMLAAN